MNRKQAEKWLSEITHYINGGNLWRYNSGRWQMMEAPSFTTYQYIIEDKHFEARKAFALGEPIEVDIEIGTGFLVTHNPTWDDLFKYRPKPKEWYNNIPKEGILCWVWNNNSINGKTPKVVMKYCEQYKTFSSNLPMVWWHNAEPINPEECWKGN